MPSAKPCGFPCCVAGAPVVTRLVQDAVRDY